MSFALSILAYGVFFFLLCAGLALIIWAADR